jgi:hypothetical protein
MDGVVKIDVANFITIGLMAFIFVWVSGRVVKLVFPGKVQND